MKNKKKRNKNITFICKDDPNRGKYKMSEKEFEQYKKETWELLEKAFGKYFINPDIVVE